MITLSNVSLSDSLSLSLYLCISVSLSLCLSHSISLSLSWYVHERACFSVGEHNYQRSRMEKKSAHLHASLSHHLSLS